jgi:hypothetical protein
MGPGYYISDKAPLTTLLRLKNFDIRYRVKISNIFFFVECSMAIGKWQPRLFYIDTLQLQHCNLSRILVIYVNLISLFICVSIVCNLRVFFFFPFFFLLKLLVNAEDNFFFHILIIKFLFFFNFF